jgi:hypothetical protein
MVTAETAVLAPVVALCLALGVWVISPAHLQVRLIDASRDTARLVARGERPAAAIAHVRPTLPVDARFSVNPHGTGYVIVRVSARSRSPLPGLSWPLRAQSTCVDES